MFEEFGFVLCNGRSISDSPANYTYLSKLGCSTIDLVWVSMNCIDMVHDFVIENISNYSDHCGCSLKIKISLQNVLINKMNSLKNENISYNHIINSNTANLLQFNYYLETNTNIYFNSSDINELYENFYQSVYDAMISSKVIIKKHYNLFSMYNNKSWYDKDCRSLKRKVNKTYKL